MADFITLCFYNLLAAIVTVILVAAFHSKTKNFDDFLESLKWLISQSIVCISILVIPIVNALITTLLK